MMPESTVMLASPQFDAASPVVGALRLVVILAFAVVGAVLGFLVYDTTSSSDINTVRSLLQEPSRRLSQEEVDKSLNNATWERQIMISNRGVRSSICSTRWRHANSRRL